MDKRYADIPATGKHGGTTGSHEVGGNVRAPMPPDPSKAQGRPVDVAYQHLHNEAEGTHHIRTLHPTAAPEPMTGYTELGRYTSNKDIQDVLKQFREQPPRYVVFENRRTGEVLLDAETNVHDNWTGDGRFDAVTVFEDRAKAEAYVDRRQKELKRA